MRTDDRLFDRFTLLQRLDLGSDQVEVWRVQADAERRTSVLKLAPADTRGAERVAHESELLRPLTASEMRAAHVAPYLDSDVNSQHAWLRIEDVGTSTLFQEWAGRRAQVDEVMDVAEAVGTALAYLHARGIVHRDVKEHNIVVDPDALGVDRYWLIDLDIGRSLEGRPAVTMQLRGSHGRVAPEVMSLDRRGGPSADVHVLCRVLAEGLMGSSTTPLPPTTAEQLSAYGLTASNPSHVALTRLLADGLSLDPSKRPSADDLVRRIADVRANRSSQKRSRAAIVLCLAASLAVVLLHHVRQPTPPRFDDVSSNWHLAVRLPDAQPLQDGEQSSGFFGVPSWVDGGVYLPRSTRVWESSPPGLLRDYHLFFRDKKASWSPAPIEAPSEVRWAQPAAFDHTRAQHLVVQEQTVAGDFAVHILDARAPQNALSRHVGQAFLFPGARGDRLWVRRAPGQLAEVFQQHDEWREDNVDLLGVPLNWIDVDNDGQVEVLLLHDDQVSIATEIGSEWQISPVGRFDLRLGLIPPERGVAEVADIDGDGDEDVLLLVAPEHRTVTLRNERGVLVYDPNADVDLFDEGERTTEFINTVKLVDLDADGLPELVLPSGGFPSKGAQKAKAWWNRGDHLERLQLPASLETPHDGSQVLVADVDEDGRPDLIDLSINDAALEIPTHRIWHNLSPHRAIPLAVALPDGQALPLGTRLHNAAEQAWLAVIRDRGPIFAPSWLQGELVVETPDGRTFTAVVAAMSGPQTLELHELSGLPLRVAPGEAGEVVFSRSGPDWAVALRGPQGSRRLSVERAGVIEDHPPMSIDGLDCDQTGRCLFIEQRAAGGFHPLWLEPGQTALRDSDIDAGMTSVGVWVDDRLWTASASNLWERSPDTYQPLRAERSMTPRRACAALDVRDSRVACCVQDPAVLAVYNAETLELVSEVPREGEPCALLGVDDGWLVSTEGGLLHLRDDGEHQLLRVGDVRRLILREDGVWALGPHRVLLLEPTTWRILRATRMPAGSDWMAISPG